MWEKSTALGYEMLKNKGLGWKVNLMKTVLEMVKSKQLKEFCLNIRQYMMTMSEDLNSKRG